MQKVLLYIIAKALGGYINLLSYIAQKKATTLSYRYFSAPRAGRLVEGRLPAILQEAKAEMITHGEFIFQMYTWQGKADAPVILLVHGWESNASRWKLLISYLKESGCTLIALDAPAHGLSPGTEFNIPLYADFINVIVDRFKPFAMVGHSLGGATAIYYQAHFKNTSLKKLVILGAPCDFNTILKNYIRSLSLNNNVLFMMRKHLAKQYRMDTDKFSGSIFASRIKIPGLVAHDTKDKTVPYKEGKKIAEVWQNSEFLTTHGLGHSMHDDALYKKIYAYLFTE